MKTLTFTFEDELELRLTELAKREGRTEIEIVREAMTIAGEIDIYTNTNIVVEQLTCPTR